MENLANHLQKMMRESGATTKYNDMLKMVNEDARVKAFLAAHADELAPNAVDRGAAKLYEFVRQMSKVQDGKETFAPGYEPELIVSGHLIDIGYRPTAKMVAAQAHIDKQRLVTAHDVPKDIRGATLAKYQQTDGRTAALVAALNFVEKIGTEKKLFAKGLYVTGRFGIGKTYLLGAMANDLADQGVSTTILNVPSFSVEIKGAIKTDGVLARLDEVKKAQVLVIDDIGAESLSPWFRDEVLGVILQYRMQEQLPTCFSSNKSMALLTDFLAGSEQGDDEQIKALRIMERVRYLSTEIVVTGENLRLKN